MGDGGNIALATRPENESRIRHLQRIRADHVKQLDEVRVKIARADERRRIERGEERKWNRILDRLEDSMDNLKSLIAACDGELIQLGRRPEPLDTRPIPTSSNEVSKETDRKSKELLKRAEAIDPGKLRGALEKAYGGRIAEVTLDEAAVLLDEFELLTRRSDLSATEAKALDAIRSVLPVIADRLQEWQIRWSRVRK